MQLFVIILSVFALSSLGYAMYTLWYSVNLKRESEFLNTPIEIVTHRRSAQKLDMTLDIGYLEFDPRVNDERYFKSLKHKLAGELGDAMIENGLVTFQKFTDYENQRTPYPMVRLYGVVDVLKPIKENGSSINSVLDDIAYDRACRAHSREWRGLSPLWT